MSEEKVLTPEGILSEVKYQEHTGTLHHRQTQPNEALILDRNARLRKEPEAFKKSKDMYQLASIPIVMWDWALRNGYQLNASDKEIADKELMRFLKSEQGKLCLVREKM